jgi:hypothetical protein
MTTSELKLAKKLAFNYLYGVKYIVLGKPFKYDARTKIGKKAYEIVKSEIKKVDRNKILDIRKKRRELKYTFEPILTKPIVKDYILHKYNLNGVFLQNLSFRDGRKHWAKNKNDLKILSVLRKNYLSKIGLI